MSQPDIPPEECGPESWAPPGAPHPSAWRRGEPGPVERVPSGRDASSAVAGSGARVCSSCAARPGGLHAVTCPQRPRTAPEPEPARWVRLDDAEQAWRRSEALWATMRLRAALAAFAAGMAVGGLSVAWWAGLL